MKDPSRSCTITTAWLPNAQAVTTRCDSTGDYGISY
jgi:hypothetical protein